MSYCRKVKRTKSIPIGLILLLVVTIFHFYPTPSGFSSGIFGKWEKRYDGPALADDSAQAIAVDAAGNVYVTGKSQGQLGDKNTLNDYATIKYDPAGNQAWGTGEAGVRRYDGPKSGDDEAKAMAIDPVSGNLYVTGKSFNGVTGNSDYVTIKYDAATGNRVWGTSEAGVRRYDGPDGPGDPVGDEAVAIAVDSGGNVYVTGKSYGGRTTNDDYATIKYAPNGTQLWVTRYNGSANGRDAATALAIDPSGFVYVTGESQETGGDFDYVTIKYDPATGSQVWGTGENGVRRYDGPGSLGMNDDIPHSLAIDPSGNVYVTGESGGFGTERDYATIKYDPAGNRVWGTGEAGVRRYDGPVNGMDIPVASAVDSGGNLYVTGYSQGTGLDLDYLTIKYDAAGNQVWGSGEPGRYDGQMRMHDFASALTLDSNGNVYVTGRSPGNQPHNDYATIKYDPNGNQAWGSGEAGVMRYNGPGSGTDSALALAVDADGNVYVTGESEGGTTANNYDYTTIKYMPDTIPPTNPKVSSPSHTQSTWSNDNTIDVSWPPAGQPDGATDNLSGVNGYLYEWSLSSDTIPDPNLPETEKRKRVNMDITSATSPPLDNGNSWHFHLRTVDKAGNWSDPILTVHLGPFFIDTVFPTRPTFLVASSVSTRQINLLWFASNDQGGSDLAGYEIERSTDGLNFTEIASTSATSYSDTGLSPATTYWYRVKARDNAKNLSGYSNFASATTFLPPSTVPGFTNVLFTWGNPGPGDIPIVGDFDENGASEAGIFRAGQWFFNSSFTSNTTSGSLSWGNPGDIPLVGDFSGDGIDDIGIFRPSTSQWSFNYGPIYASGTDKEFFWGNPGDTPLIGNFDGIVGDDVGIRRSSTAQWFFNTGPTFDPDVEAAYTWGNPGGEDIPIVGDFDGNIAEEAGIFRSLTGQWFFNWSFTSITTGSVAWGSPGDTPLVGDFNGNGIKDDISAFRPSTGRWYFNWGTSYDKVTDKDFQWGNPGDTPLVGDFNNDGRYDVAIRRPSTAEWFINWSSLGVVP